jgi:hypothetical protein
MQSRYSLMKLSLPQTGQREREKEREGERERERKCFIGVNIQKSIQIVTRYLQENNKMFNKK